MTSTGFIRSLGLLLVAIVLTACGGGGGSDGGAAAPPRAVLTASTGSALAINTRSAVAITVRATLSGANLPDNTVVNATVNGVGIGNISAVGSGANGATAQGRTTGGVATFIFQSGGSAGNGSIVFSVADAAASSVSSTVNVTVNTGPGSDPRISFVPEKTTLPINTQGVPFFFGSPFISEVVVNIRSASGQAINATRDDDQAVQFSVDPTEFGAVSIPDDPETDEVNELTTPWIAIFAGVTSGTSRAFVWSFDLPGTVNLRATFTDPDTGQRVEGVQQFTINSNIPPLPANVDIQSLTPPIYAADSGGTSNRSFQVYVSDGNGVPVPNPVAGNNAFNNIRLEVLTNISGGDARLSANNAAGAPQEAQAISVRTEDGIATVLLRAGVRTGLYTVRATVDRADNNVDNGVSDALVAERTIAISDGRLFDIEITQPNVNALLVNPVDPNIEVDNDGEVTIPPSPDGSYSLTVAAIATDRLGNPVLPGTVINFGLIDEPQETGIGDFEIAGLDGNPQEAGTTFTAVGGRFTTAGGGAGPGDALVIFGEDVEGNRDHESARVIQRINSATNLTVTSRFNNNDDTGTSVDSGGILPYVIGRAADGNILASAETNDFGVARTLMNYPVSKVGKRVIVWAQSNGDIVGGTPETVTDVEGLVFAGVAPLQITASPSSIPANGTFPVSVCVLDGLDSPLPGVRVGFTFAELDGLGSVDGVASGGVLGSLTGADGCAVASVSTSGVSEEGGQVVFFVGGAEAPVEIVRGELVLQARPSVITNSSTLLTLTLLNGAGVPQPGYQIVGECTGESGTIVALSQGPGVTNANGVTTVLVTATNLDQVGQAGGGSCEFRTVDDSASVTVPLIGQDICDLGFSPEPVGCPTGPQRTLTVNVNNVATTVNLIVGTTPDGLLCGIAGGATQACTGNFSDGATVSVTVVRAADGTALSADNTTWSGDCAQVPGLPQANVVMSANRTCTLTIDNTPPVVAPTP